MLNTELIENLYAGLSKEQQQELLTLLFKRSKQTLSYFKRTKDITLSKLEILADFFHMPLDYFRMGNTFKGKEVIAVNLVKWLTLFEAKSRKLKRRSWSWF